MGLRIDCDYCGKELTGGHATVVVAGSRDGPDGNTEEIQGRTYYLHPGSSEEVDSCYRRVTAILERSASSGRRSWLNGTSPKRTVNGGRKKNRSDEAGEFPTCTEFARRVAAGTPLRDLLSSGRAVMQLRRADLVTVEECAGRSKTELLAVDGVGERTIELIEGALGKAGLQLRDGVSAEELGERLSALRAEAGATGVEVAQGVSELTGRRIWTSLVRDWEAGTRVPNRGQMAAIAEFFDVGLDRLTGPGAGSQATRGRATRS